MVNKVWIPEISEEELNVLNKRIMIVADFPRIGLFYISKRRNTRATFLWDLKPTKAAKGLKVLRDIKTYHEISSAGWFNASIRDVIAQIPKEIVDQVVAFQIIKYPKTSGDLDQEPEALNAGYHVATTRLYTK